MRKHPQNSVLSGLVLSCRIMEQLSNHILHSSTLFIRVLVFVLHQESTALRNYCSYMNTYNTFCFIILITVRLSGTNLPETRDVCLVPFYNFSSKHSSFRNILKKLH